MEGERIDVARIGTLMSEKKLSNSSKRMWQGFARQGFARYLFLADGLPGRLLRGRGRSPPKPAISIESTDGIRQYWWPALLAEYTLPFTM